MKHILVPTDFSAAANNALEYALQLAIKTGASVTLLNVYHVPLPAGEFPMMLVSPHEILEKSHECLNTLVESAKAAHSKKLIIAGISREGFAAEEIVKVAKDMKADFVVMGTKGTTSSLSIILGSVAAEVMKKSNAPVLVIPIDAKFRPVKQIVCAFDTNKDPDRRTAQLINRYADIFDAEVSYVNVVTPGSAESQKTIVAATGMYSTFAHPAHQRYFVEGVDVIHELTQFISDHKTDWLVVVPHAYGFFQALFHRSIAKQIAMQISVPILSIHE